MTDENYNSSDIIPGSGRSSSRKGKSHCSTKQHQSSHNWDFESYFPFEPSNHQGRIRASSWDDSDDNLPQIPDISGSKTCRIYTNDDKNPRPSVSTEINELKKIFFKNRDEQEETEVSSLLERVRDELEKNDRRLSPARVRRRTRSSGSSSPALEMENQISPTKVSKGSESDSDFQDVSPKALQCDPTFYLNNFFTELKSKRISLMNPISMIESIGKEMSNYDNELCKELSSLEGKDLDEFFLKTSRKLSQILEVEENRKELEKSSEEYISRDKFEKCFKNPQENNSPLQTARSKRSDKNSQEESRQKQETYKSISSEQLKVVSAIQKPSQGSLSERSARFFDRKLDDEFIALSAKTGRIQLASPKNINAPTQVLCVKTTDEEQPDGEKKQRESLTIDLMKNCENATPRKSSDRSDQSQKSRSGRSRRSSNIESPKFMLNIGKDSARSSKVEDVNDCQRKDNPEECSFRKSNPESGYEPKTEGIPPLALGSPSMDSVISTRRSLKEEDTVTNRSKSQTSSQRSHRKKRKERNSPGSAKEQTPRESKSPSKTQSGKSYKSPRKSSTKSINNETEQISTTPKSRTSTSPNGKSPKTTDTRFSGTPRSNKIPELNLDFSERPESQRTSHRSGKTVDTTRKDSDRSETKRRTQRQPEPETNRSRHAESSPQVVKMTPRTNSGSSRRSRSSRYSLENRNYLESFRIASWKEIENIHDTASNHSVAGSWREETPSQEHSNRSEVFADNKERLSRSRNSSRTSIDSNMIQDNSPARSTVKSRPNSCTSKEYPSSIPLDDDGRTHRSLHPEDETEEDTEESEPTQGSKMEDESDRTSSKRLSVINEASFEDLGTSNVSTENEEKISRKDTERLSPKQKISTGESGSSEFRKTEGEQWSELIKKFNTGPDLYFLQNFPGFARQKDISWNSNDSSEKKTEENSFKSNNKQRNTQFEKSEAENRNLVCQDPLIDKTKQEEFSRPMQTSQNIYYLNVTNTTSFGIGEFGDVTCWNPGELYTKDMETPKDHGDGIPMQRTPEVRSLNTVKEEETQLIGDNRNPNKVSLEVQDDIDTIHYIPCRLKISKSDNCINKKLIGGSECRISTDSNISKYKFEAADVRVLGGKRKTNKEVKCRSKSTINSSSGSLESGNDWENLEFECERTPRLSKSLSNLEIRLQDMFHKEQTETLSILGCDLFKRSPESSKIDKESANLNLYLECKAKEDKMATKFSNPLSLKQTDVKQGKKVKTKLRKKGSASDAQPFLDRLPSRKGRPSVPYLKLRHPNCFQNFYKRFISVFCLTSNSSAATSK